MSRHGDILLYSVARGELALVKHVFENPEMELHDLSYELYKAVCLAADNEFWDIVLYLLQPAIVAQTKNLYNEYQQIFQYAVERGQLLVINRLLEQDCIAKGVNPAANANSAIVAAKLSGNAALIARLLSADCIALGVDPAAYKNSEAIFLHEYELWSAAWSLQKEAVMMAYLKGNNCELKPCSCSISNILLSVRKRN